MHANFFKKILTLCGLALAISGAIHSPLALATCDVGRLPILDLSTEAGVNGYQALLDSGPKGKRDRLLFNYSRSRWQQRRIMQLGRSVRVANVTPQLRPKAGTKIRFSAEGPVLERKNVRVYDGKGGDVVIPGWENQSTGLFFGIILNSRTLLSQLRSIDPAFVESEGTALFAAIGASDRPEQELYQLLFPTILRGTGRGLLIVERPQGKSP